MQPGSEAAVWGPRPWQPFQNQTAMPAAKARKVPISDNMNDSEGDGGGNSSQTGGGVDPPDAERAWDWQGMEDDTTGPRPGKVFWQYLSSIDKWGTCSWQDFNPEWSDNVEGAFSESQRGAQKNSVNLQIPDEIWSASKKKTSTTLYKYDFILMTQTNEKTGTVRRIRRLAVLR